MKIISIAFIQSLLLVFNVYAYREIQKEIKTIEENGCVKVFILQIKDKGKYGIKYNVEYQEKIYYNIVGLKRNIEINTFDTSNFYYRKDKDMILFKGRNNPVFNVIRILFILSFLLWFLPKEKFKVSL